MQDPPAQAAPRADRAAGERALRRARDHLASQVREGTLAPASLPHRYAAAADRWLGDLFERATGGDPAGCALVGVGGLGRRALCPGSDLDLVLVHRGRRGIAAVADRIWYAVWDGGVRLDHSVRTPKEAIAVATDDLPAMLGLLDGRLVAGDGRVAGRLLDDIAELWRTHARRYLLELAAGSEQRATLFGEVPFLLEPDLKESRGGLRDLEALSAASRALPALAPVLEPATLTGPADLLVGARVTLQALTASRGDRLVLQEQDHVAPLLGFDDADDLMAAVAAAGREVLWTADDAWRRVRSFCAGPTGRAGGRDVHLSKGVVLRDGEISIAPGAEPAHDPGLVLEIGLAAAATGSHLSRTALERLGAESPAPPEPWPEALRQDFVALLGCGTSAIAVIEALDQQHLVELVLPEWRSVRNRPQRNAYHRYTVDRHLLETAARAADRIRSVRRPDLLLVGALLHDIGKGCPGDHSERGRAVAEQVARRMGFDERDVAVLGRLVGLHLLLPDTATRRDVEDPATSEAVARAVGDLATLELLAALAEADGLATGPAAWSPWKSGLVAALVQRARAHLTGEPAAPATSRSATAEQRRLLAAGRLAVVAHGPVVTVVAPDQPGLLAVAAGTLALHRLEILRAFALAADHEMALEVFEVAATSPPDWTTVESDLADALAGRLLLEARLETLEAAYQRGRRAGAARPTEVRVLVDNDASPTATVVEVRAPDGHGLLHRLTRALADVGLDVTSAQVSTLGHEVVDSFYVRDAARRKLEDPATLERIVEVLATAAGRVR